MIPPELRRSGFVGARLSSSDSTRARTLKRSLPCCEPSSAHAGQTEPRPVESGHIARISSVERSPACEPQASRALISRRRNFWAQQRLALPLCHHYASLVLYLDRKQEE